LKEIATIWHINLTLMETDCLRIRWIETPEKYPALSTPSRLCMTSEPFKKWNSFLIIRAVMRKPEAKIPQLAGAGNDTKAKQSKI
jgi:hypothetical protein